MRIRDAGEQDEVPVNMTSMMDIVFNLLIFFLVATTMAQEERDLAIQLPNTSQARPLSAPPQQLIINIKEDGSVVVVGKTYDAAALSNMLSEVARDDPGRNVLIRADQRVIFGHVAGVYDLCLEQGIPETKIGYFKTDG